jgi:hypothetical protein
MEIFWNFISVFCPQPYWRLSLSVPPQAPKWGMDMLSIRRFIVSEHFAATTDVLYILLDLVSITIKNGILFRKTVSGSVF